MVKTQTISARIDPELKSNAEKIFHDLGLTTSQAITLFYKQVCLHSGLPFTVSLNVPNEETVQAIQDAQTGDGTSAFSNVEELFDELNNVN